LCCVAIQPADNPVFDAAQATGHVETVVFGNPSALSSADDFAAAGDALVGFVDSTEGTANAADASSEHGKFVPVFGDSSCSACRSPTSPPRSRVLNHSALVTPARAIVL